MFEFSVKNDTSYYNELSNLICTAVKATAKKHELDDLLLLKKCLKNVIMYCAYNKFTASYGIRTGMAKYFPVDYANLIIYSIKIQRKDIFDVMVREYNGKYYINAENMAYMINYYAEKCLYQYMERIPIDLSLFEKYDDKEEKKEEKVINYHPSNECRKAILNNTQTSLRNSSVQGHGMNAYSDVGKKRNQQEDSYYIGVHPENSNFKLLAVADGMGGMNSGEIASNIAIRELMIWFENLPVSEFYDGQNEKLADLIRKEIEIIQRKICSVVSNGGTTLCFSIIKNDSILFGNIGDSQGYVLENGRLIHMTVPRDKSTQLGIPREISRYYSNNNQIYNFLGQTAEGQVSYDITLTQVALKNEKKYKVILCSDGVSDCLSDKDIINIANKSKNPAKALVETAIENDSYLAKELDKMDPPIREQMNDYLKRYTFNYKINGGKDNTTAVGATVERGKIR